jgi:hypothetical protein
MGKCATGCKAESNWSALQTLSFRAILTILLQCKESMGSHHPGINAGDVIPLKFADFPNYDFYCVLMVS